MTASDELLQRNARRIRTSASRPLPVKPTLRVALVTCMDCRIDLNHTLGLKPGEAHVIRNAGGAITDDVIRSLAISQQKLGTHEILLMHHTRCGMATFTEAEFKDELERTTGLRPTWSVETFTDTKHEVRQSMRRVQQSPFLTKTTSVRGFVHDIETGTLTEVV